VIISTTVFDCSNGRPAAGLRVHLDRMDLDRWSVAAVGTTGADGQVAELSGLRCVDHGVYRITYQTDAYFAELGLAAFHPEITLTFMVAGVDERYDLTLLISPHMYLTYRRT
jgi:5-hydroxyisourate hydrolase